MTKKDRELVQEAKDFMITETAKHGRAWKGLMTEEWMAAFAKEKGGESSESTIMAIRKREEERQRKILEGEEDGKSNKC